MRYLLMLAAATAIPGASYAQPVPPVVERMTFPAAGDDAPLLQGELCLPQRANAQVKVPGVVICHPHPLYGGTMDNTVVMDLRDQLLQRGLATLRFNFRGVGGSQGEFGHGAGEIDDVLGALATLRARPEVRAERCGLVGYSFGSSVASKAATRAEDLGACGLVGFPTEIEGDGMDDFAHLAQVRVPVLFVSGSADPWSTVSSLLRLAHEHQLQAEVVPIEGADHFFAGAHQRRLMAQTVADFLARHLIGELQPPEG